MTKKKPELPLLFDTKFYRALETVCKDALTFSGNSPSVRRDLADLHLQLKFSALKKYGHDTVETVAFSEFLKHTSSSPKKPKPLTDPIQVLSRRKSRWPPKLNADHVGAAQEIRNIWAAWGRCLMVGATSYEPKLSSSSRALDPIQVMGPELLNVYHSLYKPWYDRIRFNTVQSKRGGQVREVSLLFDIIINCNHPKTLDRVLGLPRGCSLDVLQKRLSEFQQPTMTSDKEG